MDIKNLLKISAIGLIGFLGFVNLPTKTTENNDPKPIKILSHVIERNNPAKIPFMPAELPVESVLIEKTSWESHCVGHEVISCTGMWNKEYLVMESVERTTTSCGGYTVDEIHLASILPVKKESETVEEKKVEVRTDFREMNYKVYPNPMMSEARLEIENYNDEPYQFELYDLTGKLVMKEANITNSVYVIPRNDLPGGIYIYRVLINSNNAPTLKSGKIVVE